MRRFRHRTPFVVLPILFSPGAGLVARSALSNASMPQDATRRFFSNRPMPMRKSSVRPLQHWAAASVSSSLTLIFKAESHGAKARGCRVSHANDGGKRQAAVRGFWVAPHGIGPKEPHFCRCVTTPRLLPGLASHVRAGRRTPDGKCRDSAN